MTDALDNFQREKAAGNIFYIGTDPRNSTYQIAGRIAADEFLSKLKTNPLCAGMQVFTQEQVDQAKAGA